MTPTLTFWTRMLVLGVILLGVGTPLAVIALLQLLRARKEHRLLVVTPTTPIASAAHGKLVELEGTVVPSEQGTSIAPASERPAVVFSTEIYDTAGTVSLEKTLQDRREFWLDDQLGSRARILPERGRVVVPITRYAPGHLGGDTLQGRYRLTQMSDELYARMRAEVGGDRPLLVEEQLIAPGERLLAVGLGERAADGTLVLRSSVAHELVLSTYSEPDLRRLTRSEGKLALVLTLVFLGVAASGFVLVVLGLARGSY
ncbi:MAG: hypothetical protein HS104_17055 [Polyangiaceae bacterium]|nr:hypothetical protein [Polyangiaceae bacterium]MCL4754070.1 hypothetical protein [Myxococcales bacterium]